MTPQQQFQLAIIQLVANLGLDVAIGVLSNLKLVSTIDDAIAALQKSLEKTAQDYLDEAKAAMTANQPPTTPVTPPSTP